MSNAWDADSPNPDGISGLGCEFILEAVSESQWAIVRLLHLMAFQILLAHGRYPGKEVLETFDRIPLKVPLAGDSRLTWLIAAPPVGVPETVQLKSGRFEFIHFAAVTNSEASYAKQKDSPGLLAMLSRAGFHPAIDPSRDELILPVE